MAHAGNIRLRGKFVAGHDVNVYTSEKRANTPFLLVDRDFLDEQSRKDKRRYVARAPDWADVVHGADQDVGFVERDQTIVLYDAIMQELLEPCRRGTDGFLHALVALGSPGAGKTTLVRRAAAILVAQGECVVADFGVSTESVSADAFEEYESALERNIPEELPLLVVLDDPFFANSGWLDFLRHLSRRHQDRVAVVAASPDFLFERFGHALFDRRVVGRTIEIVRPSERERRALALLYNRDPETFSKSDEDLLVVAMEAASGESFASIVGRMWTTLNNGIPPDPATRHPDLSWAIIAFAVVCYFHRNYVRCPVSMVQKALEITLGSSPPEDLARELDLLVTREGWHIFSTKATLGKGARSSISVVVGATHARVAREALACFPLKSVDVQRIVIDSSVRTPDDTAQLAELILATYSSKVSTERRFVQRLASTWSAAAARREIAVRAASSLSRWLTPSRECRMRFRPVLRACLGTRDPQSWLIVWQLYQLATPRSDESRHLREVALPWSLKIADLSYGPDEAIEIATRVGGETRQHVTERLIGGLKGKQGWRPDAVQVAWLVRTQPRADLAGLLEPVWRWLDEGLIVEARPQQSSDNLAVIALLELLDSEPKLGSEIEDSILQGILDWLLVLGEAQPEVATQAIKTATARARSGDFATTTRILSHAGVFLKDSPAIDEDVWVQLTVALRDDVNLSDAAQLIVPELVEWLRERPETNEFTWSALFGLVGRTKSLRDWAKQEIPRITDWLRESAVTSELLWSSMITVAGRNKLLKKWVEQEVPRIVSWLRGQPEANEAIWSAAIAVAGRSMGLRGWVEQEIPRIFDWLRQRPELNEATWSAAIAVAGRTKGLETWVEQELPGIAEWLQAQPEVNKSAWATLLPVAARTSAAERILMGTLGWLCGRPEANDHVWGALLAVVRKPSAARFAEAVAGEVLIRLRMRDADSVQTWISLVRTALTVQLSAVLLDDIVAAALTWLRDYPGAGSQLCEVLLDLVMLRPSGPVKVELNTLLWLEEWAKSGGPPAAAELFELLV